MLTPRSFLLAAITASALALAGCGGSDDESTGTGLEQLPSTTQPTTTGSADSKDGGTSTGKPPKGGGEGKESDSKPSGKPPTFAGTYTAEVDSGDAEELGSVFGTAGEWRMRLSVGLINLSSSKRGFANTLAASDGRMTFVQRKVKAPKPETRPKGKQDKEDLAEEAEEKRRQRQQLAAARKLSGPCVAGQKGVYSYELDGGTITFKVVSDPCAARRVLLEREWSE